MTNEDEIAASPDHSPGADQMQHSRRQYSPISLWTGLVAALLLVAILTESACLGILYLSASLTGEDVSAFAKTHLLTKLFASTPHNPVPGKNFIGSLQPDAVWGRFVLVDGLLGFRLAPNIAAFDEWNPDYKYLYITDNNGFITDVDDPPVTLQKPIDSYRVIILGGSTVMGEGAPRPSQNIVGMLRKGVRERGLTAPNGKRFEFINAGGAAYTSAQEYLYLVSDLLRFKPDLVIVYDGWNDSTYHVDKDVSPFRITWRRIQTDIGKIYSITGPMFFVARNLTYFLTRGSYRVGMIELPWRVLNELRSEKPDKTTSSSTPFDDATDVEYYDLNRRAFIALADDKLSVALFLQPVFGADDRTLSAEEKASWWYHRLDKEFRNPAHFYEQARHVLTDLKARNHDNGHLCIADLSHSLRGVSEPVYADTGHLLPKGNEVVASHMLDQLAICGLTAR